MLIKVNICILSRLDGWFKDNTSCIKWINKRILIIKSIIKYNKAIATCFSVTNIFKDAIIAPQQVVSGTDQIPSLLGVNVTKDKKYSYNKFI